MKYKLVFIGSTGGGVLSRVASHRFVKDITFEAVSDRDCGFLDIAKSAGIPAIRLLSEDGLMFSEALYKRYAGTDDIIYISFYTRLLGGKFVANNEGRIVNCHPSILPSFKGMKGFEDTLESHSLFMGCTLHIVDQGMDSGRSVIQAAVPLDRRLPSEVNRHKVFLVQYYSTLQFIRWVYDERLRLDSSGAILVDDLSFLVRAFAPNLDDDFFEFIGESNELA